MNNNTALSPSLPFHAPGIITGPCLLLLATTITTTSQPMSSTTMEAGGGEGQEEDTVEYWKGQAMTYLEEVKRLTRRVSRKEVMKVMMRLVSSGTATRDCDRISIVC